MGKKPPPPTEPKTPKTHFLQVRSVRGKTDDRVLAEVVTDGIAPNASTAIAFMNTTQPDLSLNEMVNSLRDQGRQVNANDFSQQEQMLNAQANALNAIFAELCRRAALNMGTHMEATERYLRLAFKAQGQCRTTVETLATIKNPPVVYAKQANIAHGPQQVNNGTASGFETSTRAPAHAHGKTESQQTKLLEGDRNGGTYLDTGAAATSTGGHPAVEAVGAVQRPEDRGRQGHGSS